MKTIHVDPTISGKTRVVARALGEDFTKSQLAVALNIDDSSMSFIANRIIDAAIEHNTSVIVVKGDGIGAALADQINRSKKRRFMDNHGPVVIIDRSHLHPLDKYLVPTPRRVAIAEDPWVIFEKVDALAQEPRWVEVARFPSLDQADRINEFVGERFHAVLASQLEVWKRGE